MKSIIELKNVSKRFVIPHEKENSLKGTILSFLRGNTHETFYALKNISLNVLPGEFVGIIGRNGSGKSTLLKMLAGVYVPDSGKVHVHGTISPFLELGVGFNGELSGRDNVYLYGAVLGLTKKEIDAKFDEIVAFAELEQFIDTKIKHYSSGMYVRLAFSIAIQSNAPILLVDEVLAVGDANFQQKCFGVFEKFKKEGRTVVFVSHDLSAVQKFCDRALLLENGKIVKIGNVKETINYYAEKQHGD